MSREDLLSEFRERIQDNRVSLTAFTLAVTATCTSAKLLIGSGFFSVIIEGGRNVSSINWDLNSPIYNTVGRLVAALNKQQGYQVTVSENWQSEHSSTDLSVGGIIEIGRVMNAASTRGGSPTAGVGPQPVEVQHHLFADDTLMRFLDRGAKEHNPQYSSQNIPAAEQSLVLTKAASIAYRAMAALAARSTNLASDATGYIALARDQDAKYAADRMLQARTLPVPKIDTNKLGTGEAIVGTITSTAMRTNGMAPYGSSEPPIPPNLYDCAEEDIYDTKIRIRWERNMQYKFAYHELWRSTEPNVERSLAGRLLGETLQNQLAMDSQYSMASTALQVFGIYRYTPNDFFFATWSDLFGLSGQNCSFLDGVLWTGPGSPNAMILGMPLEPDTDYFYRLFSFNTNRDCTPSKVIKVHTKSFGARFRRQQFGDWDPSSISANSGPLSGGTVINVFGTNFTNGVELVVYGKKCNVTVVNSSQLTATIPGFSNPDLKNKPVDMFLRSPNGIVDLLKGVWTYV